MRALRIVPLASIAIAFLLVAPVTAAPPLDESGPGSWGEYVPHPDDLAADPVFVDVVAEALGPGERATVAGHGKLFDAGARTDTKDKPVLMIHGRDSYDMGGWASLRTFYTSTNGFTGGVHRVGYYGGECNVEYRAEHHGDHNKHYGGSGEHSSKKGCDGVTGSQVHDLDTDIRHIAYHVAWMIYDHFTAAGKTIDGLGHSMGGLLLRYAVAKTGQTDFPATLKVEDATTFGSPHGGLGTSWCKLSPWADVRQMCSDSSFLTWLKSNAKNPQGTGGTDWTVMGSDCDGWVAWNLAVDMNAAHKVVAVSPCLGHSDYYTQTQTTNTATMDYMDAPATTWTRWTAAPHAGKWSVNAAIYGTW